MKERRRVVAHRGIRQQQRVNQIQLEPPSRRPDFTSRGIGQADRACVGQILFVELERTSVAGNPQPFAFHAELQIVCSSAAGQLFETSAAVRRKQVGPQKIDARNFGNPAGGGIRLAFIAGQDLRIDSSREDRRNIRRTHCRSNNQVIGRREWLVERPQRHGARVAPRSDASVYDAVFNDSRELGLQLGHDAFPS